MTIFNAQATSVNFSTLKPALRTAVETRQQVPAYLVNDLTNRVKTTNTMNDKQKAQLLELLNLLDA